MYPVLQAITGDIVRSAPKLASKLKILARRDHLEQYFINSQISLKFQILSECQQKNPFRVCGLMTNTLAPLELTLYEGYGVLLSRVLWLDT